MQIRMGANVAIIRGDEILLTRREDFEVWCLPGGLTEPGESLAQTARREAREETGFEVKLLRLVGVYSRLGGYNDLHGALFAAEITGGELNPQVSEVLEADWFTLDALPQDIFWWHVPQIKDALSGQSQAVASVAYLNPHQEVNSRQELYALRDSSGLARAEFYRQYFEEHGQKVQREV